MFLSNFVIYVYHLYEITSFRNYIIIRKFSFKSENLVLNKKLSFKNGGRN